MTERCDKRSMLAMAVTSYNGSLTSPLSDSSIEFPQSERGTVFNLSIERLLAVCVIMWVVVRLSGNKKTLRVKLRVTCY
jgi:hypothetical protein